MNNIDVAEILSDLKKFRKERDWEQFHTIKNLVCSLNVESAELLEHFVWSDIKTKKDLKEKEKREIAKEVADVFNCILLIADELDIDLKKTTLEKIKENAKKYPMEKAKGISKKYNEL